ncbi:MAG: glycosyltransferase 4 family protein [Candidatus Methanomethylicaceae archaeon]|jgi:UDP-N-acetylglucosamine--dolichyl-phosphate N-acetylglucosaminephosphotransferase
MNLWLLLAFPLAFSITLWFILKWIKVAKRSNIMGKDMNKVGGPLVPEMGGIPVLAGILSGFLFYIAINTFILSQEIYNVYVLAGMATALIIFIVGILDDLLGWKIGLSKIEKPLLTIPAAIPMMVINAGHSLINLPFIGNVDLGILYPLLIVPIGIVIAANAYNMLAGYNGLECGMGIIMFSAITIVCYFTGSAWVALLGGIMISALAAFMIFNWYPAKIFPGNAFTYMVGAMVAVLVFFGNVEKLALILFIPYYLDFILPLRKKMNVEAYAKVNPDGSLDLPYDGIYDLTHLSIKILSKLKKKVYENEVVALILAMEVIIAILGIALYL